MGRAVAVLLSDPVSLAGVCGHVHKGSCECVYGLCVTKYNKTENSFVFITWGLKFPWLPM
jgi:hypothetical protein